MYLFGTARGGAVRGTSLCCGTELILRPVKQLRMQNRKCLIAISMHIRNLNNITHNNMLELGIEYLDCASGLTCRAQGIQSHQVPEAPLVALWTLCALHCKSHQDLSALPPQASPHPPTQVNKKWASREKKNYSGSAIEWDIIQALFFYYMKSTMRY